MLLGLVRGNLRKRMFIRAIPHLEVIIREAPAREDIASPLHLTCKLVMYYSTRVKDNTHRRNDI